MEHNKLIEITREACAIIHEQLPENDYVIAVFQERSDGIRSQTLQGRVDNKSVIALVNALVNELAQQTGTTREHVFDTLKRSGDPAIKVVDYRRQNHTGEKND